MILALHGNCTFAQRYLVFGLLLFAFASQVAAEDGTASLADGLDSPAAENSARDFFVDLEAVVIETIEDGDDHTFPLTRMWASARKDANYSTAYLESMERLLPHIESEEEFFNLRLRMAATANHIRDIDYADQIYTELAALDPDLETPLGRTARYQHAHSYLDRGDNPKAVAQLRELWDIAAQHHSQDEFLTFGHQLVDTYYRMEDWERLVEVAPALAGPLGNHDAAIGTADHLAEAYSELGDLKLAAEHYQRLYNYLHKLRAEDPDNYFFQLPGVFQSIERKTRHARMRWDSKRQFGSPSDTGGTAHNDDVIAADVNTDVEPMVAATIEPISANSGEATTAETMEKMDDEGRMTSALRWIGLAAVALVLIGLLVKTFR